MAPAAELELRDFGPARERFLADALAGLLARRKTLPCKYFYDARGSELFDRICALARVLPDAHGARRSCAPTPARWRRRSARTASLVEYGSAAAAIKTRLLLDRLARPAPTCRSTSRREHLAAESRAALSAATTRRSRAPGVRRLHRSLRAARPAAGAAAAGRLLPGLDDRELRAGRGAEVPDPGRRACGPGGALLIGVDLKKPRASSSAPTTTPLGVTAEFNLNLLRRAEPRARRRLRPRRVRPPRVLERGARRGSRCTSCRRRQVVHLAARRPFDRASRSTPRTRTSTRCRASRRSRAARASRRARLDRRGELFSVQYLEAGPRGTRSRGRPRSRSREREVMPRTIAPR